MKNNKAKEKSFHNVAFLRLSNFMVEYQEKRSKFETDIFLIFLLLLLISNNRTAGPTET